MITKLIFLDIDGVLNSHQHYYTKNLLGYPEEDPRKDLCMTAVSMLYKILEAHPECKIVISSTWRLPYLKNKEKHISQIFDPVPHDRLRKLLKDRTIDATPCLRGDVRVGVKDESRSRFRGEDIQLWLDTNKGKLSPEMTFVILDDDSDMSYLYNHFIKIDGYVGLTYKDAIKAIDQLKTPRERRIAETSEIARQLVRNLVKNTH